MESVFGFISVLPGAFSAYRFASIDGEPLKQYFKQINSDITKICKLKIRYFLHTRFHRDSSNCYIEYVAAPFKGNMYLAEDRILCFEVLAEKNHKWKLKYVAGATAATDVPIELTDLIKQRRRWLNGSLFAAMYAIANIGKFFNQASEMS
jgi:chitin synthase